MRSIDTTAYLTIQELADEVDRLGSAHDILEKGDDISPRTIRFYIHKGLLPPVRSGPGKKYPYESVWKVLFIRLLNTRHGLSLNHLRQTMQSVDADTMRRVVTGEEPLEVASPQDSVAIQKHVDAGYQVVALTDVPDTTVSDGGWLVLLDSSASVFRVRSDLAPAKLKQLQQIAELVDSIVEYEENGDAKSGIPAPRNKTTDYRGLERAMASRVRFAQRKRTIDPASNRLANMRIKEYER